MVDPISSLAAGINSTIKILEVTYQLKAVDEQTNDLLSTTTHVNKNVSEARRLRSIKAGSLNKEDLIWTDSIIEDTEKALQGVAQLIEPARIDRTTDKNIKFGSKVAWVFRDSPKVRDKHSKLSICHQSLLAVITTLHTKHGVAVGSMHTERKDEAPPPYDPQMEELFKWQDQRKRRKSYLRLQKGSGFVSPSSPSSVSGLDAPSRVTSSTSRGLPLGNINERLMEATHTHSEPHLPSEVGSRPQSRVSMISVPAPPEGLHRYHSDSQVYQKNDIHDQDSASRISIVSDIDIFSESNEAPHLPSEIDTQPFLSPMSANFLSPRVASPRALELWAVDPSFPASELPPESPGFPQSSDTTTMPTSDSTYKAYRSPSMTSFTMELAADNAHSRPSFCSPKSYESYASGTQDHGQYNEQQPRSPRVMPVKSSSVPPINTSGPSSPSSVRRKQREWLASQVSRSDSVFGPGWNG